MLGMIFILVNGLPDHEDQLILTNIKSNCQELHIYYCKKQTRLIQVSMAMNLKPIYWIEIGIQAWYYLKFKTFLIILRIYERNIPTSIWKYLFESNQLFWAESLRSSWFLSYSRISQRLMEPKSSSPCSQRARPLVPILNQKNPVHNTPSYFSEPHFILFLHLCLDHPSGFFPASFSTKIIYSFFSPCVLHAMPISSPLTCSV
jgi:hypothetical protein